MRNWHWFPRLSVVVTMVSLGFGILSIGSVELAMGLYGEYHFAAAFPLVVAVMYVAFDMGRSYVIPAISILEVGNNER